jgi:hypothetical protein
VHPPEPPTAPPRGPWRDAALIAGLLLTAVALRGWLLHHTEVPARDTIGFIRYALEFERHSWPTVLRNNHQHPGYPLTVLAVSVPVRAWGSLPEVEAMTFSAGLASNLAAVLLLIPVYFLGKLLFHRAAGFGAALLFQCLPVPAHILSDGLSEPLFLLCASSALALAVAALRGSRPWLYALAGGCAALAYLTRPEGVLLLVAMLAVLFGLQLLQAQRRSALQLFTCATSLIIAAVAVGSPYLLATRGLTNKPSISIMLGKPIPPLGTALPEPPAPAGRGPLFAFTLNNNDPVPKRAFQAAWGLVSELVKCFHYVAWLPTLVGMWMFRRRPWSVPGMWVPLVFCGLLAAGLCALAVRAGYMSDRHLLLLVLCGCYAAAAALWELPLRWLPARWAAPAAVLLLVGVVVASLPKAMETLHANRVGHHAAGLWLADHADPADLIVDDHCWAHYYAGRVFQEAHPVVPPPEYVPVRYVVVGRRERDGNLTYNRQAPVDEAQLRAEGGRVVYHWPANSDPTTAAIVVYSLK